MRISDFALGNKPAVYVLILIAILSGTLSYINLPREASPDIQIPFVIVTTVYPGTSPRDMESLITNKLEQELVDIDNIKEMKSFSQESVSNITLEFDPEEDVDDVINKVREKVDLAQPELPGDAEDPIITELNFGAFPILLVNISAEYDQVRLKRVAEEIQDRLEDVPGVLEVGISGGLEREVQVNVNPDRLRHYRVSLEDVQNAIRNENITVPGGKLDIGDYSYLLRVPGEVEDPLAIRDFVVKADEHNPILIRDVASVEYAFKDPASYARMKGHNCITLAVSKRSGENIIHIVEESKRVIAEMLPELPATTTVAFTSDQSKDIAMMVGELENGILTGLILVVAVLFIFMGLRTSLFVAVAIPLSMLISFFVLDLLGYTLNMVVLFSLILALGMLVDNAIVIVENIYRYREEGYGAYEAAHKGVSEVGMAVTASTVTTLVAFFPLIFWPGIMGEFMSYLPITLIITLSASLFVGLVMNPVLCATLMKLGHKEGAREAYLNSPFLRMYKRSLGWALDHRWAVLGLSFLALFGSIGLYGVFGAGVEFFPDIDPKKVFVDYELPSGSRLDNTDAFVREMEKVLPRFANIETYVAQVGVATGDFDTGAGEAGPPEKARINIDMVDREFRIESTYVTIDSMRAAVADVAGATVVVQKLEEGPPTGKPVNIEIRGKDFLELGRIATEVERIVQAVPGVVNLQNDFDEGRPEIVVSVNREKAAMMGVNTAMIGNTVRTAMNGSETGSFRDGEDEYDITVRLDDAHRASVEDIADLQLQDEGDLVPLSSLATVAMGTGIGGISHIDRDRVVTVFSDVSAEMNAVAVLGQVKEKLKDLDLPAGYRLQYTGESKDQAEAEEFLGGAFLTALLAIGLVLVLQFRSVITPIVILFCVLLSLVGVFIGLTVTQMPFGIIMTGVGVISLAGVVVNNAIVLLDYTEQLRQGGLPRREALLKAGTTRLRPVLLTAGTTVLGLVPMATGVSFDFRNLELVIGSDSAQWWGSMATAVIFGLFVATALTLMVVPALFTIMEDISLWFQHHSGKLVNREAAGGIVPGPTE
jgi:multidrug efflux pump